MTAGWGGPASDSGRISFTATASTRPEPSPPTRYRTGRKNRRTIYVQAGSEPSYEHDVQVGTMDTPELGCLVVELLNQAPGGPYETPEWAHLLLTAFLFGTPLNFGQARVPADVMVRLDQAYADGTMKGTSVSVPPDLSVPQTCLDEDGTPCEPERCQVNGPHYVTHPEVSLVPVTAPFLVGGHAEVPPVQSLLLPASHAVAHAEGQPCSCQGSR